MDDLLVPDQQLTAGEAHLGYGYLTCCADALLCFAFAADGICVLGVCNRCGADH